MVKSAELKLGKKVVFNAGSLHLEGLLYSAKGPNAALITHPHPLYGGDMNNAVVAVLADVYRQLGYSVLRFNFRGVGTSGGHYDEGCGEQDDVRAAANYLAGLGKTVSDLVGYSFGSWVNWRLQPPLAAVRRQVLIAPPIAYEKFDAVAASATEYHVIVGDCDDFAPLPQLREQMSHWRSPARLHVLSGADHIYSDALDRLAMLVEQVLKSSDERC